ncbi:MAG: hypothetical protein U0234_15705 [Sandaracinus sp.]
MRTTLVLSALLALACGCSTPAPSTTDGGAQGGHDAGTQPGNDAGTQPGNDAGGTTSDPDAEFRARCIAEINRLRATRSLPPYSAWTGVEECVDAQATSDERNNSPHGAWGMQAGVCDGNGQNECLGQGRDNIEGCLQQMWAEREQPGCAGCDACANAYDPNCPNCDFYGSQTGDVCGHYVNLSALYLTQAACGFSDLGGWDVINFR